jgi:Bacterial TniB protein
MTGKYSHLTFEERVTLVKELHVDHSRFAALVARLEDCRVHTKLLQKPQCMLIEGDRGVGKTRLIDTMIGKHPSSQVVESLKTRTIIPVFTASTPAQATPTLLVSELLEKLGDLHPDAGKSARLLRKLRHLMKECGVEQLFLDEFQHFIDRQTDYHFNRVSDWLKLFIDATGVSVILLGIPNSRLLLDANEQLQRRFQRIEVLRPFGWTTTEERTEFCDLMKQISRQLPFDEKVNLGEETMAFRFFCASQGYFSTIATILEEATITALKNGQERLDLSHFAAAVNYANGICPAQENPFLVDHRELKLPEPRKEERVEVPDHLKRKGRLGLSNRLQRKK